MVNRGARGEEQAATAPATIRGAFGCDDRAQVLTGWAEDPQAARTGRVHVAQLIGLEAVRAAGLIGLELREDAPLRQRSVIVDRLYPQILAARVGDVKQVLLRAQRNTIGALALLGNLFELARARHLRTRDAIDGRDVRALVGIGDVAARHVAEVDRAVDVVDQVVGRTEALVAVTIGKNRDRPVLLGAGNAARARLARQQPSLMIKRQSVGAVGLLAEDRERATLDVLPRRDHPLVDLFASQVAEQQEADAAVDRAFGEAEPSRDLDDLGAAVDEVEQVRIVGVDSRRFHVTTPSRARSRTSPAPGSGRQASASRCASARDATTPSGTRARRWSAAFARPRSRACLA